MTQMIESQAKRHKALLEFERERDRNFMEFKQVEAEKNRQHELQIAQIFASAMHNQGFQRAPYSTNTNVYQTTVHQGKRKGAEFLSKSLLLLHHVLNILTNKCLLSIPREVKQIFQGIFFLTVWKGLCNF